MEIATEQPQEGRRGEWASHMPGMAFEKRVYELPSAPGWEAGRWLERALDFTILETLPSQINGCVSSTRPNIRLERETLSYLKSNNFFWNQVSIGTETSHFLHVESVLLLHKCYVTCTRVKKRWIILLLISFGLWIGWQQTPREKWHVWRRKNCEGKKHQWSVWRSNASCGKAKSVH